MNKIRLKKYYLYNLKKELYNEKQYRLNLEKGAKRLVLKLN